MSAYGAISRSTPSIRLPTTHWVIPSPVTSTTTATSSTPTRPSSLTIHHLTLQTAHTLPGLIPYFFTVFKEEVRVGRTYPQETCETREVFEAYFFAADVFVAILGSPMSVDGEGGGEVVERDIEEARGGREWDTCLVGFYYIKPNYPGRSSHICNAGFMTPPSHRGRGYASALARSYLFYAPRLGYEASVFNLVYVNNAASVRIWDKLGFTRAGLIPRAGRLRTADGTGEEYIDAILFYKRFDPLPLGSS